MMSRLSPDQVVLSAKLVTGATRADSLATADFQVKSAIFAAARQGLVARVSTPLAKIHGKMAELLMKFAISVGSGCPAAGCPTTGRWNRSRKILTAMPAGQHWFHPQHTGGSIFLDCGATNPATPTSSSCSRIGGPMLRQ